MNRDEVAALVALQRSLGWRLVVREYQRLHEDGIRLVMNPDTPHDLVDKTRQFMAGVTDVLGWPKRVIDMHAPVEEAVRAGFHGPPEEEE